MTPTDSPLRIEFSPRHRRPNLSKAPPVRITEIRSLMQEIYERRGKSSAAHFLYPPHTSRQSTCGDPPPFPNGTTVCPIMLLSSLIVLCTTYSSHVASCHASNLPTFLNALNSVLIPTPNHHPHHRSFYCTAHSFTLLQPPSRVPLHHILTHLLPAPPSLPIQLIQYGQLPPRFVRTPASVLAPDTTFFCLSAPTFLELFAHPPQHPYCTNALGHSGTREPCFLAL